MKDRGGGGDERTQAAPLGPPEAEDKPDEKDLGASPRSRPPRARPLRLLLISSDTYPATRVDVSVLFGEEMAARGHRTDCILQSEVACDSAFEAAWGGGLAWVGPTDCGTSLFRRVHKHLLGIAHDTRLFSRLRGHRYDIVQVKDKFVSGVFALIASRLYGCRFVYWLSFPFPELYVLKAQQERAALKLLYTVRAATFKLLLYRLLLPAADHVFVQSEQMRRDIAREGTPLAKMTVVPMGIKLEAFSPRSGAGTRGAIPTAYPCVLYLGSLSRVRRLDFLVRVIARVRADIPAAKLYFVGRGEDARDEQLLINEARRLNVEPGVVLVGQLPQPAALRYVEAADVCVSPLPPMPVLNAASPTKLVEYMAMGRAVVANDHPEQRQLIDESGGGICVPYDEAAFASAIVTLLHSPELRRRCGELGREYVVRQRSYARIADRVEEQMVKIAQPASYVR